MKEFEKKIGISNENHLMSSREKLGLIGLLYCLKPERIIEFGFHRGGTTRWLAQFAKEVITVDVNEFVTKASEQYPNVEAWNCSTSEALKKIIDNKLSFDLAIVDADHSRKAVCKDISGLINHADVILMHDSFNPECRKGMQDALKYQNSHAYYLDFVPSVLKHDGLWGGLGIAWRSKNPGSKKEFLKESSSYFLLSIRNTFHKSSKFLGLKSFLLDKIQRIKSNLKIFGGKILRKN